MLPRGQTARRMGLWLALAIPAALIGGAYVSQYGIGLFPCEMCWWQRYPHFVAIALGLLGVVTGRPLFAGLAAAAIMISGLIGLLHAGVEYHWWQGFTACTTMVKPGGDPLDAIMNAPMIRCDTPQWTLLGISLAGFNFLISTGGAVLIALLLGRGRAAA